MFLFICPSAPYFILLLRRLFPFLPYPSILFFFFIDGPTAVQQQSGKPTFFFLSYPHQNRLLRSWNNKTFEEQDEGRRPTLTNTHTPLKKKKKIDQNPNWENFLLLTRKIRSTSDEREIILSADKDTITPNSHTLSHRHHFSLLLHH